MSSAERGAGLVGVQDAKAAFLWILARLMADEPFVTA